MNKFFRILSLIFLALIFLGSFIIVVVRFMYGSEDLDDFDVTMISICGITALLAMGSFFYHIKRLRRSARRKKTSETDALLDDHLVTREVQKQKIPLLLRVANIFCGLWAAIITIMSLDEAFSPYTSQDLQLFFLALVAMFGYLFIYNIVGSLAHFIKHGN